MAAKDTWAPIFQQLIDCLDTARRWKSIVKLKAQAMNLQGEKRRNRHEANMCHEFRQSIQTLAMDLLKIELHPTEKPLNVPNFTSYKEYFVALKEHLWWLHDCIHKLANSFDELCILSQHLHCMCACIVKEAMEIDREINEGDAYGWSEHVLFLRQTSWNNINDHYKNLEHEPW